MRRWTYLVAPLILLTAQPAFAQDGTTLVFSSNFWDVGSSSETRFMEGLTVSLKVVQRDNISGRDMIYVRGTFCNKGENYGQGDWTGGQRISDEDRGTAHASLRVPGNQCRSWSEWLPANVRRIYVYVRRDRERDGE